MDGISVVIPCYNAEAHVGEAVASAFRQSRRPLEVIVVDDGSTDDSRRVARTSGARLLAAPSNVGPSAARNLGLKAARGELIGWLDADDLWLEDHLERVAGLLDRHPSAVLAFSSVELRGDREMVWAPDVPADVPVDLFWPSFRNTTVPQMSAVTRRAPVLEAGGYDETIRIAADYEFFLRLARRHPFVRADGITAVYRQHPGQITARKHMQQIDTVYRTRARLLGEVRREGDAALAESMAERMHEYWEADLRAAWEWNDHGLARFFVDLAPVVPAPRHRKALWAARVHARETALRGWWTVRPLIRGS